jgi:hypothetical protein
VHHFVGNVERPPRVQFASHFLESEGGPSAARALGYGRATMSELVRRLRLQPDVELVATSHRTDNLPMARLCTDLGFEPWATPFPPPAGESYLCLHR